jgi:hypothetical protein
MHAVEAETKEMLNLLCGTQSALAWRPAGAREGWQARDGYHVSIRIDGAGLSQLAHRGACHDPEYVA